MNNKFKKHVFVCQNIRNNPSRKSCGLKGVKIHSELKKIVYKNGLNKDIRINKSGCLDQCEIGPCLVVYPMGKWYTEIDLNDCEKIFLESLGSQNVNEE